MTRRIRTSLRSRRSAWALAGLLLLLIILLYWQAITYGLVTMFFLRIAARRMGFRSYRHKASFATNLQAVAMVVTAWHTRRLPEMVKARRGDRPSIKRAAR